MQEYEKARLLPPALKLRRTSQQIGVAKLINRYSNTIVFFRFARKDNSVFEKGWQVASGRNVGTTLCSCPNKLQFLINVLKT